MKLSIPIEKAFYLLKHFENIDFQSRELFYKYGYSEGKILQALTNIGSKFFYDFCQSPFKLINKFSNQFLIDSFQQDDGSHVFRYCFHEYEVIGYDNLINIGKLNESEIEKIRNIKRNDYLVKVVDRKFLEKTNELILIKSKVGNQIVTAFPGKYAPPFPIVSAKKINQQLSESFWEQHAFIELNK